MVRSSHWYHGEHVHFTLLPVALLKKGCIHDSSIFIIIKIIIHTTCTFKLQGGISCNSSSHLTYAATSNLDVACDNIPATYVLFCRLNVAMSCNPSFNKSANSRLASVTPFNLAQVTNVNTKRRRPINTGEMSDQTRGATTTQNKL